MSGLVSAKARQVRSDPLLAGSLLVLTTTVLMAGAGALFWVIAARLVSPEEVGVAGSLAATADALALFAQLGLNVAIVRTLPASDRKAADVTTAAAIVVTAGMLFALAYGTLLPAISPKLSEVVHSPVTIALYCVLVGATALNVLTDSAFLAMNRAWDYLRVNGIVMGLAKCALPFVLAGAGALGVYGSIGGAVLLAAALSLWLVLRNAPGRRSFRPSRGLRDARRFAGAAYVTYVLSVVPVLLYPLLVINSLGASDAGAYFISYQIATLLTALLLAVANSAYAQCERAESGRRRLVRKAGLMLVGVSTAGALAMTVLAPYVLGVFGAHYVAESTATLRVLALSAVGAALFAWAMMGLRLSRNLPTMIGVQLVSTVVMLAVAVATVSRGTEWVAASFGIGHLVGAALGHLAIRTWARFDDRAAVSQPPPVPAEVS